MFLSLNTKCSLKTGFFQQLMMRDEVTESVDRFNYLGSSIIPSRSDEMS